MIAALRAVLPTCYELSARPLNRQMPSVDKRVDALAVDMPCDRVRTIHQIEIPDDADATGSQPVCAIDGLDALRV